MKFGIAFFATDTAMDVVQLARAVEERGFESFWLPEHTHIPVSRRSPWPGGGELPERYKRTLDPFVAMGALAVSTERVLLGFGIVLLIQRDPIITAKAVATLDLLSGGRVLFGVGGGWNLEEMENHGTEPKRRWRLLRERVLAMKEIWTQDVAEFHGELVDFGPIWSWPKPVQKPHPPVLVGGNAENTLKRVIEYGDGWIPNEGRSARPLADQISDLRRMSEEAGRGHLPVTVYGTHATPEAVEGYARAGVDRLVFWMPSEPDSVVMPRLEKVTALTR
ncbi:MAG: LLM class F420-dependent oxidoreductase [Chloroflexi bacterium]|nr:MAG: LLM class F420-dependent oxidoreductase [Chloroflexota bacterium]TME14909.1 MAG: LLM class F420-dependent oxidoreductase [Chloroflexota bacterium]TME17961.1 MAG: LLM class F420-dependent oxidoreductase [Chloroflexota bacterium]